MWHDGYQAWLSEAQSLENSQIIVSYFEESDWTKESLSAMLGNMRHESSVNPNMYEYGYDWSDDRGYGLVQWTPRSKYWNWAVSQGLDPEDGFSQLKRIEYEVNNNIQWIPISSYGNMTFEQFRTNSGNWSVDYLTEAFTWSYERPNNSAGWNSMPARKAFANKAYTELDFGLGGGGKVKPHFPTTEGLPITSPYGWRNHPITGVWSFHGAIDIGGNGINHPVYATQDGVIYENRWSNSGGWMLFIDHSLDRYFSRYIHLDVRSPLAVGTRVYKGQVIGTMGTTGDSTGIHLDFAIATSKGGFGTEQGTIDPLLYLDMEFEGGGGGMPSTENDLIHMLLCDALNGWK